MEYAITNVRNSNNHSEELAKTHLQEIAAEVIEILNSHSKNVLTPITAFGSATKIAVMLSRDSLTKKKLLSLLTSIQRFTVTKSPQHALSIAAKCLSLPQYAALSMQLAKNTNDLTLLKYFLPGEQYTLVARQYSKITMLLQKPISNTFDLLVILRELQPMSANLSVIASVEQIIDSKESFHTAVSIYFIFTSKSYIMTL